MSTRRRPTHKQLLADRRQELRDSVGFYSNENKGKPELWVVERFLRFAGEVHAEADLQIVKADPPDIRFRDIEFEVKEIQDPGRRRHDEYREKLVKAEAATRFGELLEEWSHHRPKSIRQLAALVLKDLRKRRHKYSPEFRKSCNIIFYINLQHTYLKSAADWPDQRLFAGFGWRSVTFLFGSSCGVFYAGADAPDFIRKGIKVRQRKRWLSGDPLLLW